MYPAGDLQQPMCKWEEWKEGLRRNSIYGIFVANVALEDKPHVVSACTILKHTTLQLSLQLKYLKTCRNLWQIRRATIAISAPPIQSDAVLYLLPHFCSQYIRQTLTLNDASGNMMTGKRQNVQSQRLGCEPCNCTADLYMLARIYHDMMCTCWVYMITIYWLQDRGTKTKNFRIAVFHTQFFLQTVRTVTTNLLWWHCCWSRCLT